MQSNAPLQSEFWTDVDLGIRSTLATPIFTPSLLPGRSIGGRPLGPSFRLKEG